MSHFTVGIITRPDVLDIEAQIHKVLEPYSENLEVPTYQRECHCVGCAAQNAGYEVANAKLGTWADKKDAFWAIAENKELRSIAFSHPMDSDAATQADKELDKRWKDFTSVFAAEHEALVKSTAEQHPLYNKPRADCDTCHGTGTYESNYNPDSKWDWWTIGGRWTGLLTKTEIPPRKLFEYPPTNLIADSTRIKQLLERHEAGEDLFTFFALVTPDGAWVEKARVGWFAMTSNEKESDAWLEATLNLYRAHEDCNITMVDCHI